MGARKPALKIRSGRRVTDNPGLPRIVGELAQDSADGIFFLGPAHELVYANPAMIHMLGGRSFGALAKLDFEELLTEVDADCRHSRFRLENADGERVGYLGVIPRRGRGDQPALEQGPARIPIASRGALGTYEDLRLQAGLRGCVVFHVADLDGKERVSNDEIEETVRALGHLTARVTRPEDIVLRLDMTTLVLFAQVPSLAAVKAIAERVAALGRREIRSEFSIGIALAADGEEADALLDRADGMVYMTKPRLRSPVTARRSGPEIAA